MTIIVSFQFFKHTVVVADSRVSYEGYPEKADDVLQKLYPFYSPKIGSRIVIGFSGSLIGAYKVLKKVKQSAKKYSKPPTATSMVRDLRRWIMHEYAKLDKAERRLSFLIAGVEPYRDTSKNKPSWIGHIPSRFVLTLIPSKDYSKLVERKQGLVQAIGYTSDKFLEDCYGILQKNFDVQNKHPEFALQTIISELNLIFARKEIAEIGGMLQCFILGVKGVQPFFYGDLNNYYLKFEQGRFVQVDEGTGRKVPLIDIIEWGENRHKEYLKPGSFGPFANPIYQEIVNRETKIE